MAVDAGAVQGEAMRRPRIYVLCFGFLGVVLVLVGLTLWGYPPTGVKFIGVAVLCTGIQALSKATILELEK